MATDDRDGIGGGALSNTYGGRDRLESMTVGGNAVTFKINAFGQRDSKAFSGATTHYVHDVRGLIIAEANGSTGSTTKEYVWMEGELLAQVDSSGNIVYVHNSHLGAPMKITNPSRTVVWDQISEPFGEVYSTPTTTTPTTHRFPGQIFDSENGLYYNNHRDYDPTMGMYVQADPIGQAGGLNQHAYAGGNPLQLIDFWGLSDKYPDAITPVYPIESLIPVAKAGTAARAVVGTIRGAYALVRGAQSRTEAEQQAKLPQTQPPETPIEGPSCKVGGGADLSKLDPADALRIQNAANRADTEISLVGSRANGTNRFDSDYDYVLGDPSKWSRVKNSLPDGPSLGVGEPRNMQRMPGPVDTNKPYITFTPK